MASRTPNLHGVRRPAALDRQPLIVSPVPLAYPVRVALAPRPPIRIGFGAPRRRGVAIPVASPSREAVKDRGECTEDGREGTFVWTRQWYPMAPLKLLEDAQGEGCESGLPEIQRMAILGRAIVVWKDVEGRWRAVEDRCAHRLAALSLGSVQEDGTLACRYHGWRFNGHGECTHIPQATGTTSEAIACSSSRSKVTAFPTLEAHGLLWVWPDDAPTSWVDSVATEPPVAQVVGQDSDWSVVDFPVSYASWMENTLDPCHTDYIHHGQNSFGAAFGPSNAITITNFEQAAATKARAGFTLSHNPITSITQGRNVTLEFKPPTLVTATSVLKGVLTIHVAQYLVPMRPGYSRNVFATSVEMDKGDALQVLPVVFALGAPVFAALLRKLPPKLFPGFLGTMVQLLDGTHSVSTTFASQDLVVLNSQDAEFTSTGRDWRRRFYLPTRSDAGVVAFHRWMEEFAGGGPPWFGGVEERKVLQRLRYHDLFDRWKLHSSWCPTCRKALKYLGAIDTLLAGVAAGLLSVAVVLVARATAPQLATVAVVLSIAALLARFEVHKLRDRFLTELPPVGLPEFSLRWPS
eukprot:evm.model.scf_3447.1 EVM.evm.TU.scf_3447.1   scf_3447:2323-7983(-)